MTWRWLVREARDFPVTVTFCLLWIAVFVAMVATRLASGVPLPLMRWLLVGIGDGHRFGDLALQDLARHEYWRLITSTFVHFSLVHLVLNLIAMYQLGTMVESWYGSYQSIFIYGLTGGGGNLVSVCIREVADSNPRIHSGGGSVVIMGLVGLCAVVGLRSRTELGWSLGRLMVFFMVATAVMGAFLPHVIDNWGHAGGAIVGIAIGFAHRRLLRGVNKPAGWGRGVITAIVIAACATAQAMADRREAPLREQQVLARRVAVLEHNYQVLARTAVLVRRHADSKTMLKLLESLSTGPPEIGPSPTEVDRLRAIARSAKGGLLSDQHSREMGEYLAPLVKRAHQNFDAERKKLWQLRDHPR